MHIIQPHFQLFLLGTCKLSKVFDGAFFHRISWVFPEKPGLVLDLSILEAHTGGPLDSEVDVFHLVSLGLWGIRMIKMVYNGKSY